jgi:hypothetical protein
MSSDFVEGELPLRCACGAVEAVARRMSPDRVNHVICGCRYCRAYARHLGRDHDMLDSYGGMGVFQMSPRDLLFLRGDNKIECLRITKKGRLRWYADCCNTPIAVTFATRQIPFMSVNCAFIDRSVGNGAVKACLGPIAARVNTRGKAPNKGLVRFLAMHMRVGRLISQWRLSGDYKYSPFFDPNTGAPHRSPAIALFPVRPDKGGRKGMA